MKNIDNELYPYFITNMLFSLLVDADRIEAANLEYKNLKVDCSTYKININSVIEYINKREVETKTKFGQESDILKMRSVVKNVVLKKSDDIDSRNSFH